MRTPIMAALLVLAGAVQAADKPPLRYVEKVDNLLGATMPVTEFQDTLGAALARQLGRKVEYVKLPRNRIMAALENGDGDVLCSYLPEWLPGDVDWTRAFIPISEVVVSSPRVKAPATVAELRGKRLGMVLGFRYPELEKILGQDYIRDDAPSAALSVRKWLAGRFDYLVVPRNVIDKQLSKGALPRGYHILTVYEVKTKCAVSRKSQISAADFNNAIEALDKAGELTKILKLR
ncbi:transporter substrate-binding domain-containing protein [Duganella sp. FT135W]|uniref:Transporter substrate-binding domain-containing protein n=1 Tax=Duganella flavida TaxID=2692175 RepID=A0A6L8K8P1_9BURK|nr:transporter substrate-binding domain-containing protein [Duganella flavida]MYM23530.1 transporter substrate-binding domain-containing protein [Duganella flavida]